MLNCDPKLAFYICVAHRVLLDPLHVASTASFPNLKETSFTLRFQFPRTNNSPYLKFL